MSIGENIRRLRMARGMSQIELAEKLGVSNKTVSSWEAEVGAKVPRMGVIEKLAAVFGVNKSELIDGVDVLVNTIPAGPFHPIRVAGTVKAGYNGLAFEDFAGYEYADVRHPEEYVYFRVEGDSMAPAINDGDLALVRLQNDVDSGQVAVVVVNGEEGTIKKIIKRSGSIVLQPFNPDYETRVFHGPEADEVHIAGLVVETKRKWV
jgi:repressor LexA